MDPQIIAAIIVSFGAVAAAVVAWWLNRKDSAEQQPSSSIDKTPIQARSNTEASSDDVLANVERKRNQNSLAENPEAKQLSDITVEEIVCSINKAPPFQKAQIAENYNGLFVSWTGYLKEAKSDFRDPDCVRVNANIKPNEVVGYSFWFSVGIANLPEIKTLERESRITVSGEVIRASGEGLSVELRPTTINVG